MKETILTTEDGIRISVNHYRNGFDRAIIICPGFMMYKDSKPFSMLSERLNDEFDIITMDFRGHGKSSGLYTFTSREHLDLEAVVTYARKSYKDIGLMGFSLGAAIAINEAASKRSVGKLMAVSSPTEFKKIENRFLDKAVLKATVKKFEWNMANVKLGNILIEKPKPIDLVGRISPVPVLFVHGDRDTIINHNHSVSLYKKANEPKKLVVIKNGLHAEDLFFGNNFDDFISLCIDWFK
ncbi:MAG: alpha/beta fold hydrolase [Candidatus Omnitrophica bacterium]|nr:alpha/beta fold hydrolase [Candidatus Omnitrophota bacterium]